MSQTVKKPFFVVAEGFGKRSVSQLESAERALPVRGKKGVSRLSGDFSRKLMERYFFTDSTSKKAASKAGAFIDKLKDRLFICLRLSINLELCPNPLAFLKKSEAKNFSKNQAKLDFFGKA